MDDDTRELLDHHQNALHDIRLTTSELERWLMRLNTPAELRTHTLDAEHNPRRDNSRVDRECLSIGVLNPTELVIFLGLGGASAAQGARGVPVAPESLLVLPIAVTEIELGADPALLGADTAVIYVLRFETVQPAALQVLR
jgi:hypothetical protein